MRIVTTILLISSFQQLHLFLPPAGAVQEDRSFMVLVQLLFVVTAVAFVVIERPEPETD
ncbi:hypothetical protein SAMN04488105_103391 [Salipiger thiooxidans]|uniref:Uncharacterized protein n=1 Tax=Salipiger thiooxidans TaxID=282683 RepID=A0A1G7CVJ1_9RHOB|nr:hypothetical protein SAMN04488105_103391 [Salipiger thiooxidans]